MSVSRPAASPAADPVTSAHAELISERSLQFSFSPPDPVEIPGWMRALGRVLEAAAPVLQYVFWAALVGVAAAILFYVGREIVQRRRGDQKPVTLPAREPLDVRPAAAQALALLEDADRLAAEGRFEEAAHLLLLRSVDDIETRRPNTLRPSLTSRDIAAHPVLPAAARTAFSHIAAIVERSLFGGRAVDSAAYRSCREAYEAFAFPDTWARA